MLSSVATLAGNAERFNFSARLLDGSSRKTPYSLRLDCPVVSCAR